MTRHTPLLLLALAACSGGGGAASDASPDRETGPATDARPSSDAGAEAGTDGPPADASPGDAGPPPPDALLADVNRPDPWDAGPPPSACDDPPALPVTPRVLVEAADPADYATGDAAYDAQGRLAVVTRDGDLYRIAPDGRRTLWAERVVVRPRGMVFLSTGELVVADSGRGMLVKVYPGGEVRTLFPHLDAPMGLEVDPRDFLYVSEGTRGAVREIDPLTGRSRAIADALDFAPGALAFSPDYRTLYVAAAGSGTIRALDRDDAGDFGPPRVFVDLVARDAACEGLNPGDPCRDGGLCRLDADMALLCVPAGECLPEDVGLPCGGGTGVCVPDGSGGAVCSGDDACDGRVAGDLCLGGGFPGLCQDDGAGGLTCGLAPCGFSTPGQPCLDVDGTAGLCADNLRGRAYCQRPGACAGRIEGAPCTDPAAGVSGFCARAGRAGLFCQPDNPCLDQAPGVRCTPPGLGGAAFCDLNEGTGQPWCRPPGAGLCDGRFDGTLCQTAAGTNGVCFDTGLEAFCVETSPCGERGAACTASDGSAGACADDGAGGLVCRPGACAAGSEGTPCAAPDGNAGTCRAGVCTRDPLCAELAPGSPCRSARTGALGICGSGAGETRLCQPVEPCAGKAPGEACGDDGTCLARADGGEPYCDRPHGAARVRGLETDMCGNVYAADDRAEAVWRIAPDGTVALAADLLRPGVSALVWGPRTPEAEPALQVIGLGGADVLGLPVGLPPRRVVVPLDEAPDPGPAPDPPAVDCLHLPDAPVSMHPVPRARGYHDVAFDTEGNVIGFDGSALVKVNHDGDTRPFAAGIAGAEGMDWLPDGSLVVATPAGLVRVAPSGAQEVLAPDLYAYGVTVGPDGMVYAADNSSTIFRVDPNTLAVQAWFTSSGTNAFAPRTIGFDLDRSLMYIGSFGEKVYSLAIGPDLTPLAPARLLATVYPGAAFLDGLAVDACGNLYIPNYESAALYRIAPDGEVALFHQWELADYGHGLEWGSGIGGWRADALYLPQPYGGNTVLEMVIGIPGRPEP